MSPDKLVTMANQIARFFASQGKGERTARDGAAGVAEHIRAFWDPRMRAAIQAHLAAGGDGLDPLAAEAVRRLQSGP